jgi:hypothetical protein
MPFARAQLLSPLVRDALLAFMIARRVKSQSEFARAVKLSTGYVCDVLARRRNLSPAVIARMHNAYGLTRKQMGDFHHRAARVAGWKLPLLSEDQRVNWTATDSGDLMIQSVKLARPRKSRGPKTVVVRAAVHGQVHGHSLSGQALLAGFGLAEKSP